MDNNRYIKSLIHVALGKEKADLVIRNGKLVNVYSGEVLEGYCIAIKGDKIAFVGPDAEHTIGDQTNIIDASGKVLAPGFIDGHFHIAGIALDEFTRYTAPLGTTSLVIELDAAAFLGYEGARAILQSIKNQPIQCFGLASTFVKSPDYINKEAATVSKDEMESLLSRQEVLGLGEMPSQNIINDDDFAIDQIAQTLARGKVAEGHCPGTKDRKLAACAASGISSCHEAINLQEAIERLRLGMYVMMREGSVRRDLAALAQLKDMDIDFRRLIIVTDGISAEELMKYGHMDYLVQKAIDLGFPPVKAIQMVTLNVAEHFGLDHTIGGIAPGRDANIVILKDLEKIKCEYVISKGKVIARDGKLLVKPKKTAYAKLITHSINMPKTLDTQDFDVPLKSEKARVTVRMAKLLNGIITREELASLAVSDNLVRMDPGNDILKVSVIDRRSGKGNMMTGFVQGYGLKSGACASSYSWEIGNPLVVVGADEADMARAINRIIEMQGGVVVVQGNEILAELPLPIGGYLSYESVPEIAEKNHIIRQAIKGLGSPLTNPRLTLQIIPCTALPYFRTTVQGLIDLKNKKYVDLIVPAPHIT